MAKINIPKEFNILGYTVKVEFRDDLLEEEGCYGQANYRDSKIYLQKNTLGTKNDIELTFLHELVHWVLWGASYDDLRNDEEFVDRLSKLLHQALKTSKL